MVIASCFSWIAFDDPPAVSLGSQAYGRRFRQVLSDLEQHVQIDVEFAAFGSHDHDESEIAWISDEAYETS